MGRLFVVAGGVSFGPALAALALGACGARSPLGGDEALITDAATVDGARGVAARDAGRDAERDAPRGVCDLELVSSAADVLATSGGGFETPRVVARAGGFDVFAPLSNGGELGIQGRRVTVVGGVPALSLGTQATVGEGSFTWAEGTSDGATLALAYTADGPTLRGWSGPDYVGRFRTTLFFPTPVSTCAGVAWLRDRWLVGWTGLRGPSYVVEVKPDGRPLGAAREAQIDLQGANPAVVAYGNGAAWAGFQSSRPIVELVFSPIGRAEVRTNVQNTRVAGGLRLAGWPSDPSAIALVWRDGSASGHLLVMTEAGTRLVDRTVIQGTSGAARALEIAPFGDGAVIADATCGDENGDSGLITVHTVAADGSERGTGVAVPLDCRGPRSTLSIAASARQAAIAWVTPRDTPTSPSTVSVAVFRCRE